MGGANCKSVIGLTVWVFCLFYITRGLINAPLQFEPVPSQFFKNASLRTKRKFCFHNQWFVWFLPQNSITQYFQVYLAVFSTLYPKMFQVTCIYKSMESELLKYFMLKYLKETPLRYKSIWISYIELLGHLKQKFM
jgi:hypothetical protein